MVTQRGIERERVIERRHTMEVEGYERECGVGGREIGDGLEENGEGGRKGT